MNQRKLFDRLHFPLVILASVLSVFPKFFKNICWALSSPFGGYLAVGFRYALLKSSARSVGKNIYIGENVIIRNIGKLDIGSNVSIHPFSYLECAGGCTIGNNTSIAHSSSIITTSHTWSDPTKPIKYNDITFDPVSIGENVWVGAGVRILSGVTISPGSIVAAGAVVTTSISSGCVVAGVPARIVKQLS